MNYGGDAAEQVVRMSLEGIEVAAKITGNGAKNIAILLAAVLKEEQKTNGKARLTNMLKSGKELKVYTIQNKDNVCGRVNYISSHEEQEHLYATYETNPEPFWKELAHECRAEFRKSGAPGKCIEARELIIALPRSLQQFNPNELLKYFTEEFKKKYGVECSSALHHNPRKTNYHIHLIYSERTLLDDPIKKVAGRNLFFNAEGKKVRTKKEILDDNGKLLPGCNIIPKGEVYEQRLFSAKNDHFKSRLS